MGVIRVERNKNFTHMANYHLRDRDLSLRAVGLMSKMLSLPEDWDYTVAGLASICKEGREAVRKTLQELEAAGYLVRQQGRAGGKFAGADYVLFEKPDTFPPMPGNLGNGEAPMPGKPVTGNPVTDIPPQVSINNQVRKDPPKAPQGAGEAPKKKKRQVKAKAACEYEPELFERFWKLYPRGEAKAEARYEWDELRPDLELMRAMSAVLKRQKVSDEWRRDGGRAVPYACRWLRNRRWEDEPEKIEATDGPSRTPAPTTDREENAPYSERRDVLWI